MREKVKKKKKIVLHVNVEIPTNSNFSAYNSLLKQSHANSLKYRLWSPSCYKWKWCRSVDLTLCDSMDCSPPGSSIHGTLQARILEWVAISFSRAELNSLSDATGPIKPKIFAFSLVLYKSSLQTPVLHCI